MSLRKELEEDPAHLKSEIIPHQADIAPVRIQLPVEVLSHIFLFYVENGDTQPSGNYLLMLVCKPWCKATISTPQLWNKYTLDSLANSMNTLRLVLVGVQGVYPYIFSL